MTDPLAQMEGYVSALTAAGIRATIDGRDVNPPAVLIRPPVLHYRFGRGCSGADWEARVYLVDAGQAPALRAVFPLLERIREALAGAPVTATPADYALADGGTVPGYNLTWTTT